MRVAHRCGEFDRDDNRYRGAARVAVFARELARRLTWVAVLTTFFAGAAFAQTAASADPAAIVCKAISNATDARLSSLRQCRADTIKLRRDDPQNESNTGSIGEASAALDRQNILKTPVTMVALLWVRARETKCGPTARNYTPIARLLSGELCLEEAIGGLQGDSQIGSPTQTSALDTQNFFMASVTALALPSLALTTCKSVRTAAAQLICADADLAAADSTLRAAFKDAQEAVAPNAKWSLLKQQQVWLQQRDQKCGLTAINYSPFAQPPSARQCLEDAIRARIEDLQSASLTSPIPKASASPQVSPPPAAQTSALGTPSIMVTSAATAAPADPSAIACKSARTASARLICADSHLAAADATLSAALHAAEAMSGPNVQKLLAKEQLAWTQQRDQKCGLTQNIYLPIAQLLLRKQCLEDAIQARIDDLQNDSQTGSISQTSSSDAQNIIITPVIEPAALLAPSNSGSKEPPTFREMQFSAPTDGISGTMDCSAPSYQQGGDPLANTSVGGKWIVKIAIHDDTNSYRMFENDTWTPFADSLRSAVRTACASALKSGRLRNWANEPISELSDMVEVYSAEGLFMAYSTGPNTSWVLQTNLPKARKAVTADLGIETWVKPNQLARNPYFFKDSLVGMVIEFDHMLSDNDAVFTSAGAQIFVSGVRPALFQDKEQIVLAGRVIGNKGVISPSGSETLLPALDYVGSYKCSNTCAGF